ncbi:MAG: hypothetical protein LH480_06800 [Rubrivivax sp.]|nr:hypothetical protein [Rubrivivax sp.]
MFESLNSLLAPALAQRLTLLLNHLLSSEPIATGRLRPHSGKRLSLTLAGWPALLPPPPVLAWRITPAGMLDWCGASAGDGIDGTEGTADLSVTIAAANPALLLARAAGGEPPAVQIEGDAQLASDVNWLLQNLRWDAAADLERAFGPQLATPLHQLGRVLAAGLRKAVQGASALGEQWRSRRA